MTKRNEKTEPQKQAMKVQYANNYANTLARDVADRLIRGDISGGFAVLPAYRAATEKADKLGQELYEAAGLGALLERNTA